MIARGSGVDVDRGRGGAGQRLGSFGLVAQLELLHPGGDQVRLVVLAFGVGAGSAQRVSQRGSGPKQPRGSLRLPPGSRDCSQTDKALCDAALVAEAAEDVESRCEPLCGAIHLATTARVPGPSQEAFDKAAENAKAGCPISRLLNAKVTLSAKLVA